MSITQLFSLSLQKLCMLVKQNRGVKIREYRELEKTLKDY